LILMVSTSWIMFSLLQAFFRLSIYTARRARYRVIQIVLHVTPLVSGVLFLLTGSTSSARNEFAETYARIQYSSLLHCLSVLNVLDFSKMGKLVLQVGCIISSETVPAGMFFFFWSSYFWKSVAFRIPYLNVTSLFLLGCVEQQSI
jgi:hypothetical protein